MLPSPTGTHRTRSVKVRCMFSFLQQRASITPHAQSLEFVNTERRRTLLNSDIWTFKDAGLHGDHGDNYSQYSMTYLNTMKIGVVERTERSLGVIGRMWRTFFQREPLEAPVTSLWLVCLETEQNRTNCGFLPFLDEQTPAPAFCLHGVNFVVGCSQIKSVSSNMLQSFAGAGPQDRTTPTSNAVTD